MNKLLVAIVLSSLFSASFADELTDKIKVGSTKEEAIAIMGGNPNDSECSTTVGVKSCKLFWKKAVFDKTTFSAFFYDVTLIADRVISTNVMIRRGDFK